MKIAVGVDHGGFPLKQTIIDELGRLGHEGVEHDDMNVLCLGARIIGPALAEELVGAFLSAEFNRDERFVRRLNKVIALES